MKKQNQKTFLNNQRLEDYQNYVQHKNSNKKGKFSMQKENEIGTNGLNNYQENNINVNNINNDLPQIHIPAEDNAYVPVNNNSFRQNDNFNNYNPDTYQQNQQFDDNTNINSNINNYNNISNNYTPNNQTANNNPKYYTQQNMTDHHLSERTKKFEQQQAYKNYLDSQVSTRSNRSQSSTRPYENKGLLPKKNNELKANPFSNKNYEFGSSALSTNPILNPTNNYGYNRYITNNTNVQSYKQPSTDKFQRAANNIIG